MVAKVTIKRNKQVADVTSKNLKVAASDTVAQNFTEMMKLLENVPSDSIESKI